MKVEPQLLIPGCPVGAVSARLTILATPTGATSVHHRIIVVENDDVVAMGARLLRTWSEGADDAVDTLGSLLRVIPTLVDPPPFD